MDRQMIKFAVYDEFFCKSISLWTIMDSKYWLMFFDTFEFDGFFLKIIYQVLESNIHKKSK